jgi:hypothetical protein
MVSPTLRYVSITDLAVGSVKVAVSGLSVQHISSYAIQRAVRAYVKPLERRTPARTVDNMMASKE